MSKKNQSDAHKDQQKQSTKGTSASSLSEASPLGNPALAPAPATSMASQITMLKSMPGGQRTATLQQIGQTHGNQYVQRLVASYQNDEAPQPEAETNGENQSSAPDPTTIPTAEPPEAAPPEIAPQTALNPHQATLAPPTDRPDATRFETHRDGHTQPEVAWQDNQAETQIPSLTNQIPAPPTATPLNGSAEAVASLSGLPASQLDHLSPQAQSALETDHQAKVDSLAANAQTDITLPVAEGQSSPVGVEMIPQPGVVEVMEPTTPDPAESVETQTKTLQEEQKAQQQAATQAQLTQQPEQAVTHSQVTTSAGARPHVDLTGATDPAQIGAQQQQGATQITQQASEIETLRVADHGEQTLTPTTAPENIETTWPVVPAPEPLGFETLTPWSELATAQAEATETEEGGPLTEQQAWHEQKATLAESSSAQLSDAGSQISSQQATYQAHVAELDGMRGDVQDDLEQVAEGERRRETEEAVLDQAQGNRQQAAQQIAQFEARPDIPAPQVEKMKARFDQTTGELDQAEMDHNQAIAELEQNTNAVSQTEAAINIEQETTAWKLDKLDQMSSATPAAEQQLTQEGETHAEQRDYLAEAATQQAATPEAVGFEAEIAPLVNQHLTLLSNHQSAQEAEHAQQTQQAQQSQQATLTELAQTTETAHQAVQTQVQAEVSDLRTNWQETNQTILDNHQQQTQDLAQTTQQQIEDETIETEERVDQRLTEAETKAVTLKTTAEAQASNIMNQAYSGAGSTLSGVGLSFDGGYEARAVSSGGIISRQDEEGDGGDDGDSIEEEQDQARDDAQAEIDSGVDQAEETIVDMENEVDETITEAQDESTSWIERIVQAMREAIQAAREAVEAETEQTEEALTDTATENEEALEDVVAEGEEDTNQIYEDFAREVLGAETEEQVAEAVEHLEQYSEEALDALREDLDFLTSDDPLFERLPIDSVGWANGFGAIDFAHDNQYLYRETSGLHGGIDFGAAYDSPVYSMTGGTIVAEFGGDAEPNVVIQTSDGKYIIYGHTELGNNPDGDAWEIGDTVEAGDQIGILDDQRVWGMVNAEGQPIDEEGNLITEEANNEQDTWTGNPDDYEGDYVLGDLQYDNSHVHLVVRDDQRVFNPVYFMSEDDLESIAENRLEPDYGDAEDQDPYSMASYVYSTNNYWSDDVSGADVGAIPSYHYVEEAETEAAEETTDTTATTTTNDTPPPNIPLPEDEAQIPQ